MFKYFLFVASIFMSCQNPTSTTTKPASTMTFYIGTYTRKEGHVDGKGEGVYKMTLDPATQEAKITGTITGMINPSYVALSPDHTVLYAVNEIAGGADNGRFEAYDLRPASFGQRMAAISSGAQAPCHINLDKTGQFAVVSNYVGGIVCAVPLPLTDQSAAQLIQLENIPRSNSRQESSHAHSSIFSPDERFVYVADLGTDRVMIYQFDREQQKLVPAATPFFELPAGTGPRHMVFSANGKLLYVINELNNTVAVLQVAENGSLQLQQSISTLPANFTGPSNTADVHLSKNGRMLYASNRGHNSIAVFRVEENGQLQNIGEVDIHGKTPRNFHLSNDGQWMLVANQDSGNISLFDLRNGDFPVFVKSIPVNTPVCIVEE